ncbi:MAG: T9SS type A sorting domain-containing protein [Candidatus Paceibacterota bacterium]
MKKLLFVSAFICAMTLTSKAKEADVNFTSDKTSVCQNSSIQFTDNSTGSISNWQWSFNGGSPWNWNTKTPPVVTFSNPGIYTVYLNITDSATSQVKMMSMVITVYPSPTVSITSNNPPNVCPGEKITFKVSAMSGSTYAWFQNDTIDRGIADSLVATTQGSYRVVIRDTVGCISQAYAYLNYKSNFSVSLSAYSQIRKGLVIDTIDGCNNNWSSVYTSYKGWWASPLIALWPDSSTDAWNYQSKNSGIVKVNITDANGCKANSDSIYLLVHSLPNPVITMSPIKQFYCSGDSISLTLEKTDQYESFQWNDITISDTMSTRIITNSGVYGVYVRTQYGCSGNTNANIIFHDLPTQPKIAQNNCDLASSFAKKYQWCFRDSVIAGATSQFYTTDTAGFYFVKVKNQYECEAVSDPVYVNCKEITGIFENQSGKGLFTLSPNPMSNHAEIKFSDNIMRTLKLYDLMGREVKKVSSVENIEIDREGLSSGAYLYRIVSEKGKSIGLGKLIIQ